MTKTRDLADLGGGFIQTGGEQRTVESKLQDMVSVKDFGADPTGATDSTAAIQAAIDSLSSGDALWFPDGTYKITSAIRFSGSGDNKTNLHFYGTNATLKLADSITYQNVAELTSGSDYVISGITFYGNKDTTTSPGIDSSYRWFNGLYCGANIGKTLARVRIENCRFVKARHSGLMMGSGPLLPPDIGPGIDHAIVTGCQFDLNEGGVSGGMQRDVAYNGNTAYNNDVFGIYVDTYSYNCTISGNTVEHLDGLGTNAGLLAYGAERVTFTGNTVRGGRLGIHLKNAAYNCSVTGNTVYGTSSHGIDVNNTRGCVISSNTIADPGNSGIYLNLGANQCIVNNNSVFSAGWDGISLDAISAVTLSGNMVRECSGSGILLSSSLWLTVTSNICLNNNFTGASAVWSGIRVLNTSASTFSDNQAFDTQVIKTQNYGVIEEGTSTNNYYAGNYFEGNSLASTLLIGAGNVVIGSHTYPLSSGLHKNVGGLGLTVNGYTQALIANQDNAVNYLNLRGSTTGNPTEIYAGGSDSNIGLQLSAIGAGSITFVSNGNTQALVAPQANAVNYLNLRGGATGNPPEIFCGGSDSNIDLKLTAKGTGAIKATNPLGLPWFTVATLPSALEPGQLIYVIDETGGATPAFSDGGDWRRVADRAVVS